MSGCIDPRFLHAPAALPAGKEPPGTHWIGGWVGPRAGLDDVEYIIKCFECLFNDACQYRVVRMTDELERIWKEPA
jgi:hypothetical protein